MSSHLPGDDSSTYESGVETPSRYGVKRKTRFNPSFVSVLLLL